MIWLDLVTRIEPVSWVGLVTRVRLVMRVYNYIYRSFDPSRSCNKCGELGVSYAIRVGLVTQAGLVL